MKSILLFTFLTTLFYTLNGQPCPCSVSNNIVRCSVTSSSPSVNITGCNPYYSISVVYTGSVTLSLTSASTQSIVIQPYDGSASNVLQISSLNTNAANITVQIILSPGQATTTLIPASSSINAPGNLVINVVQMIPDAGTFKVFDTSSTPPITTNFASYMLTFNTTSGSAGNLNLPNLIYGLQNLSSILISGNNHSLLVDKTKMPSLINVNQISLKNLILSDQILININNLQSYYIEACQYSKTSSFLNSTQSYYLSLTMKNNIPVDSVLPFRGNTFTQLGTLTNLIVIEPLLNSSFLKDINTVSAPAKVEINLGNYYKSDMVDWAAKKPLVRSLTIENIKDLSIFPPLFFYEFYAIHTVILQGSFDLEESDICSFVGINIQTDATYPIVTLNTPATSKIDNCANTYITAINIPSINNIKCPADNSYAGCQQWANETNQCGLINSENSCFGTNKKYGNNFFYNGSYLYQFFTSCAWLNSSGYNPDPPITKANTVNIGAIIGAICGLVAAIAILAVTVYCIYRHRQKDSPKITYTTPAEKYKISSHDPTHVSIATSKSSKSSRYALEQSFFPTVQPIDEIAPPLYTAPSESVGSVSTYNVAPSAPPPPTRRDSASTHATHVYETLDS